MSATATYFLVDLGDILPESKLDHFISNYPSKAEISTSAAKRSQLDTFFFDCEQSMMSAVFAEVSKRAAESPVLLFAARNEKVISD